jgi:hypothetical protein
LHGAVDLLLLAPRDVGANCFCRTFNGFGGNLQASQQVHLLATVIKRSLLAHQRVHAAHSRGELRILNIQFDIRWELAGVTVAAEVVGSRYLHLAHCREDRFGAQLPILGWMAAATRNAPVFARWCRKLQQLAENRRPRPTHRRTHYSFDGFQVHLSRLAAALENRSQKLFYFARDLLTDRFGRFFFLW